MPEQEDGLHSDCSAKASGFESRYPHNENIVEKESISMEEQMKSPTYGEVPIERVAKLILEFFERTREHETAFEITIGTDSQNYDDTKVVQAIAAVSHGHGGIYFYEVQHIDRLNDVRVKLNYETGQSLELANKLLDVIEGQSRFEEMYLKSRFVIHVDAGMSEHGKTKDLIPGIVGWVKACGYDVEIKPGSYTASHIADRISK